MSLKRLVFAFLALSMLMTACGTYSQSMSSKKSGTSGNTAFLEVRARKANGSTTQDWEIGWNGARFDCSVELEVGKGLYRLELLDADGNATLTLEARDGQKVGGRGTLAADSFGEASYRVTAEQAEDMRYRMDCTAR